MDSRAASPVRRSYLFVPGNRPDRYDKACATRAHAVIVDLEDAVPPDDKARARASLAEWLSGERSVMVRVNGAGTPWFDEDIRVCTRPGVDAIVLPKAEQVDDVRHVAAACPGAPIFPLIETARGLWNAPALAEVRGVQALMFGSLDFQADLGTNDDDLLYARSQLVLVSRVTGIDAPIDGVTQTIDDPELLRRDCHRSRQLGFAAKVCIHPDQIDIVNGCFAPSADDVAWAERIVAAFEQAKGNAVQVDGKMVDRPVLLKAQAILDECKGRKTRG